MALNLSVYCVFVAQIFIHLNHLQSNAKAAGIIFIEIPQSQKDLAGQ